MTKRKVGRPICAQPSVEPGPKAWANFATELIKQTLEQQNLGYVDLSEQLKLYKLIIAPEVLNRRINRKGFSAGFLLTCLYVLGVTRITFRGERWANTEVGQILDTPTVNAAKPPEKGELMEGIMRGWG